MATQYFTATSIDGFIADPDNSLDWLFQAESSADKEGRFTSFFAGVGAMAMGATTYEWVLQHDQLLRDPGKWHEYYAEVPAGCSPTGSCRPYLASAWHSSAAMSAARMRR